MFLCQVATTKPLRRLLNCFLNCHGGGILFDRVEQTHRPRIVHQALDNFFCDYGFSARLELSRVGSWANNLLQAVALEAGAVEVPDLIIIHKNLVSNQ